MQAVDSMIDDVTRRSSDRIGMPARVLTIRFRKIKVPRNTSGSISINIFSVIYLQAGRLFAVLQMLVNCKIPV